MYSRVSNQRFLVLGARGLVGTELGALLAARGLWHQRVDRGEGDITDPRRVKQAVADARANVVVNCAAYNAVDRAESEPDEALRVNRDGARIVAEACAEAGAVTVHYSTDFVFAGDTERASTEQDEPRPQSSYARSKLAGDDAVRAANPRHLILRVGNLYGRGGRNFGSTMLERLRAGQLVRADGERRVQPTWGGSVARQTLAAVQAAATSSSTSGGDGALPWGLYHCMSHGDTTWAEFARELARLAGYSPALVEGAPSASLPTPAPRPRYALLENRALAAHGIDLMPHWRDALTDYLSERLQESP